MPEKRAAEESAGGSPAKKACFTVDHIITVLVGEEKITHHVHESVLRKCPFFDKCLSHDMVEKEQKRVELPEDKPEAFDFLVKYLYFGIVPDVEDCYVAESDAWNIADKYCLPELSNAFLDKVRASWDTEFLPPSAMSYLWKQPEKSMYRRAFFDQLHYDLVNFPDSYRSLVTDDNKDDNNVAPLYEALYKALVEDGGLLAATLSLKMLHFLASDKSPEDLPDPSEMTGCVYHKHEDGKECS